MTATHGWPGNQAIEPIVRDEAITLGAGGELVGIVSHPSGRRGPLRSADTLPGPSDPGFLLLNAGVLHRVGPHRLHVVLARRLAATGIACLRLDLGGIGDSVATSAAASFRESAVADTRIAMTGLTGALGLRRFVLFGICAGADNALATALVDDRVAGIILVDPPAYPTRRGQVRHLLTRVARRRAQGDIVRWGLEAARRRARGTVERTLARLGEAGDQAGDQADKAPPRGGREPPPAATFRAQLTELVDRGVRVLAIYSGIHGARYSHADQLFELFPELRGRVDRAYFPGANHTFTELAAQGELIDTVLGWMARHHG